uniref:Apple domain-containing protein n=1 Tax=Tetradesmus obliquus TaxID=3088 RepID=A0A383VIT8_TETOB|eukprot:jgi/Sobl393_1/1231/SZX65438.1
MIQLESKTAAHLPLPQQQLKTNLALVLVLLLALPLGLNGFRPISNATAAAAAQTPVKKCPISNCIPSACKLTGSSWSCSACSFQRVPNAKRNECVCPAGKIPSDDRRCTTCPADSYCPAAATNINIDPAALIRPCPANTLSAQGASKLSDCVNAPGYSYKFSTQGGKAAVTALPCPADSYCVGLAKQPQCTPCSRGFKTDPADEPGSATSPAVCVPPPGYQLTPGSSRTLMPCPSGSFKGSYGTGNCTSCQAAVGKGFTTAAEGAESEEECRELLPGYALLRQGRVLLDAAGWDGSTAGLSTKLCPQGYVCLGGPPAADGLPQPCPRAMLTVGEGADSTATCLTPPGWFLPQDTSLAMQECPSGTWKKDWDRASSCSPCGNSGPWLSEKSVQVQLLNLDTGGPSGTLDVRGARRCCYIQPGMGVLANDTGEGGFWVSDAQMLLDAIVCPPATYGIAGNQYLPDGLIEFNGFACVACAPGMITAGEQYRAAAYVSSSGEVVAVSEGGFVDGKACTNRPGWGFNTNTFSGNESTECCPMGTTTYAAASTSTADCAIYLPGWGAGGNGEAAKCPQGSFAGANVTLSTKCTACPEGTTTPAAGATSPSQCSLCGPGYGGPDKFSCTKCSGGFFQPADTSQQILTGSMQCMLCPTGRAFSYSYTPELPADVYYPPATSVIGASSSEQCLSDFAQTVDGAFFLELRLNEEYAALGANTSVYTLRECIQACREQGACAAATFNYESRSCSLWKPGSSSSSSSSSSDAATLAAAGGIAFKTWMSTYGPDDKPSGGGGNSGGGGYYDYNPYDPSPPPPPDYGIVGNAVKKTLTPQSLGSGYFTFWPNATAALASIAPGVLQQSTADSLSGCLAACTMDSLCSGALFGAYDAASGAIAEVAPGVRCMRLKGSVVEGDPRRTLVKAKDVALR